MSKKRFILLFASVLIIVLIIAFACYSFGLKQGKETAQNVLRNNTTTIGTNPKEGLDRNKTTEQSKTESNTENQLKTKLNDNWVCVPGERVGNITAKTTEEDLKRIYGVENIISKKELIEEGTREVTITYVYAGTNDEIKILWGKDQTLQKPIWVWISNNDSKWITPEGIAIGTPLDELKKINKDTFVFNGFGWDYGGVVSSWGKGILSKYNNRIQITLGPDDYNMLTNNYLGDGVAISSNDEGITKLKIRVSAIKIALSEIQ